VSFFLVDRPTIAISLLNRGNQLAILSTFNLNHVVEFNFGDPAIAIGAQV